MMPSAFGGNVVRVLTAVTVLCGGAGWAHAQGIGAAAGSLQGTQGQAPSFSKEQLDRSLQGPRPPPTALPGAAPKQEAIAPPSQVPTLMSPTDELFDAINRGDIATVRDALNRGADLSTPNQLGLTPLDLSVDLGRNDISFLLLSMRGGAPAPTGKAVQTAKARHSPATRVAQHSARQRSRLTETAQAGQPNLPTLFSGDGGAPVPQAGFLGFSGR